LPKVRVNQVGYLPEFAKHATYKTTATEPLEWQLVDASGKTVATGKTVRFGEDKAAGELLHTIDFSSFKTPGKGYKLGSGSTRAPLRHRPGRLPLAQVRRPRLLLPQPERHRDPGRSRRRRAVARPAGHPATSR
jgi:endoglucanase